MTHALVDGLYHVVLCCVGSWCGSDRHVRGAPCQPKMLAVASTARVQHNMWCTSQQLNLQGCVRCRCMIIDSPQHRLGLPVACWVKLRMCMHGWQAKC